MHTSISISAGCSDRSGNVKSCKADHEDGDEVELHDCCVVGFESGNFRLYLRLEVEFEKSIVVVMVSVLKLLDEMTDFSEEIFYISTFSYR